MRVGALAGLAAAGLPLVLAVATLAGPRAARAALRTAWVAPLPALVLALAGGAPHDSGVAWLLLGLLVAVDPWARVLLVLSAALWLAAAATSPAAMADDPRRGRFAGFLLAAMGGNFLLLVAADVVSFYAGFAVMTYAAYGLVIHDATAQAVRAARVYLVFAVAGEGLLLGGLLLAVAGAGTLELAAVPASVAALPARDVTVGLLLAGFGIKAGLAGLHGWLPLAHPAAPVPASAVLSGCMIKAGLVGWLRFLPLGEAALPGAAAACLVLGLAGAFGGAAAGLGQAGAKAALAYSSVSQMGLMVVLVGVALAAPDAATAATGGAVAFALHHGLAKGALFLGVGVAHAEGRPRRRRAVLGGLGLGALALAGAPLTSGMAAKELLKDAVAFAPAPWDQVLDLLVPLSSAATALLLGRFLLLAAADRPAGRSAAPLGLVAPWVGTLAAVAIAAPWLPGRWLPGVDAPSLLDAAAVWEALWPVGLAGAVLTVLARWDAWPALPAGDAVVFLEKAADRAARRRGTATPAAYRARETVRRARRITYLLAVRVQGLVAAERVLARLPTAGALMAGLLVAFALVLILGTG